MFENKIKAGDVVQFICLDCKKEASYIYGEYSGKRKYCSLECRKKYYKKKINEIILKHKWEEIIVQTCKKCQKKFEYNWQGSSRKYCSKECTNQYFQNIYKGKKLEKTNLKDIHKKKKLEKINFKFENILNKEEEFNYFFKNLYKYDIYNFNGARLYTLLRDSFECQVCGCRSKLQVHHKDGKGLNLANIKERNNDLDNLVTLCNNCHDAVESEILDIEYCQNYIIQEKSKVLNQLRKQYMENK